MGRGNDRKPVAMGGKLRVNNARQDVTLSDLSLTGCRIEAVYLTLFVGQRIILRPEGLEGLNGIVSWWTGPSAGIKFDTPLHPSVVDFLVAAHPDENRPIAVEIPEAESKD
jgi:hypothetical protein